MNIVPKLIILNRYYRISRFYIFLKSVLLKAGIFIGTLFLAFYLIDIFIIDIRAVLDHVVAHFNEFFIYMVFFISEMLMGILPPEIFIAWSLESIGPWIKILILSGLSYFTGVLAYALGVLLFRQSSIREYINNKVSVHVTNLHKWGGIFIFAGAMLPLPHSLVSFSAGLIRFKFNKYLLWSLFRFVRFFMLAIIMFYVF